MKREMKQLKPKEVRAIRISESMWKRVTELAYRREMRPSEYVRRIIEAHIVDGEQGRA